MTHARATLSRLLGAAFAGSLVFALSIPALADDAQRAAPEPDPAIARVMVQIDHAQQQFRKLTKSRTTSNRIKTLDRALHFLRSARGAATKRGGPVFDELLSDIDPLLVRALNDKTRLHVARSSFSKAARSNDEALAVDDGNDTALGLRDEIIARTASEFSIAPIGPTGIDDGVTVLETGRVCRERSLVGLRLSVTSDRRARLDRLNGVRGRTRFRLGSGIVGAFDPGSSDLRARFGAPPRTDHDPGRAPPPTTRVGAAAGRIGPATFGVFPPARHGSSADRSRTSYPGSASGRLGSMSFGVFPQVQNRAGERLPQSSGIGGAAAGRMGTMSFGVFPQVQNRAGQPVGHSSGFVGAPSPRTNAAARFNPGAISR